MTRRSIDVTPSLARAQGCVETTIPFSDSTITAERSRRFRSTVSLKELSIPDRARREFEEARAKLRKRDPAAAASHLKKAVEIAPQYMLAWNDLGMIAYRAGRWSDAETCFRKALEIRPTSVMVAVNLGGALYYAGKYKEAVEYNKLAVERSPNNALANFQLGMSYFMLEQDELSLKYLSQAKKLDPSNHSNPQLMLASIHARRGDAAAALGELQDFLERHPDSTLAPKVREELARFKR
jgi:tetratricopeptide (TPR) repeat protein